LSCASDSLATNGAIQICFVFVVFVDAKMYFYFAFFIFLVKRFLAFLFFIFLFIENYGKERIQESTSISVSCVCGLIAVKGTKLLRSLKRTVTEIITVCMQFVIRCLTVCWLYVTD